MQSLLDYLRHLHEHGVRFVVVGGVAAILHGSSQVTQDVDICAPLDQSNLERILAALRDLHPRFRIHPSKPALGDDPSRFVGWRSLNLETDWGVIDILGEITGIGGYAEVAQHTVTTKLGELSVEVLDLPSLIQAKKAANRAKDRRHLPELEFILRTKGGTPPEKT